MLVGYRFGFSGNQLRVLIMSTGEAGEGQDDIVSDVVEMGETDVVRRPRVMITFSRSKSPGDELSYHFCELILYMNRGFRHSSNQYESRMICRI